MDVLFVDPMFNKEYLFLLGFFSVIAVFYINNLSWINYLTSLSPVDRNCFNWSDIECGKGAELFNVIKQAISKGLHGFAW